MQSKSKNYPAVPEDKLKEATKGMDIFDDIFARHFFKKKEVVAEVLKNITGNEDIIVDDVKIQEPIDNIFEHSVILDVFVTDEQKNIYDIELQKESAGANKERVRYYSGMAESEALERGKEYNKLHEKWTIFITDKDLFKAGYPFYHVDKVIRETGARYEDGDHLIFVNGSFKDRSTPEGNFIADLTSVNPYEISNPIIKQRMMDLKKKEKGVNDVSTSIMDVLGPVIKEKEEAAEEKGIKKGIKEGIEKGRNEEKINNIVNTFKAGLSLNGLVQAFHLPADEIKDILQQHNLSV